MSWLSRARRPELAGLALAALALGAALAAAARAGAQPPQPPRQIRQTAPAQPRQDAQSSYEPRSGPGAGQALLARFVGDWEVVKTFYPMKGEPVRSPGECQQKMVHDGHFLESDFVFFDKDGGRTTGTGVSGFDPKSGRFTTVWFDSRGTTMSLRKSEGTFDGKEIVLYAASLEGKPPRNSVTRAHLEEDGRVLVHRQYLIQEDGKERLMMELRLTRKGTGGAGGGQPARPPG